LKISDLCNLIEESFHSGKYPLSIDTEKTMSSLVKIVNKSSSDDFKEDNIIIETRINDFFVLNNYTPALSHLPGIIEMDCLESFKMLSRRIDRISSNKSDHLFIKK
jgi:hypothetical protein